VYLLFNIKGQSFATTKYTDFDCEKIYPIQLCNTIPLLIKFLIKDAETTNIYKLLHHLHEILNKWFVFRNIDAKYDTAPCDLLYEHVAFMEPKK
jgi:hypothetical protein